MKHAIRLAATTSAALLALALGAPSASAGEFGDHVSACARTTGFDGTHNPGMHRGFAGWDAHETC